MKKRSQVEILRKEFSELPTGVEPMTIQILIPVSGRSWVQLPLGAKKNSFSEYFDLRFFIIYTLPKSPIRPFIIKIITSLFWFLLRTMLRTHRS